jgi:hypothetical protein
MHGDIVTPRRAARAPARCPTTVTIEAGTFPATTEDVGARGCQLVAPTRLQEGEVVWLQLQADGVPGVLRARGRVAWTSAHAPWRAGIAFEETAVREGARFMRRLLGAHPHLSPSERVPQRIPLDWTVYLAPPPRRVVDFSEDEVVLLRAIASGARMAELVASLRDRWAVLERALFSLLARNALTFLRGEAVPPGAWRAILAELEASYAAQSLDPSRRRS